MVEKDQDLANVIELTQSIPTVKVAISNDFAPRSIEMKPMVQIAEQLLAHRFSIPAARYTHSSDWAEATL